MVSALDKDEEFGSIAFSIGDDVHECAFVEFFNGALAHPYKESLALFFVKAWETGMDL